MEKIQEGNNKISASEIWAMGLNPNYDFPTDELNPCVCGFKPNHYSVYYSRTPYDVVCPHCKKQLNFAKCKVTGGHGNAIDYWNSHLANITKEQMEKEVELFQKERKDVIKKNNYEQPREYAYFWEHGKGEVLYQRW